MSEPATVEKKSCLRERVPDERRTPKQWRQAMARLRSVLKQRIGRRDKIIRDLDALCTEYKKDRDAAERDYAILQNRHNEFGLAIAELIILNQSNPGNLGLATAALRVLNKPKKEGGKKKR